MFHRHHAAHPVPDPATVRENAVESMLAVVEGRLVLDTDMVLRTGERPVFEIEGAGLVEPRRGPGRWEGRSAGVSVPVIDGIRLRVGRSRGRFVRGEEAPTVVDMGTLTLTSERAVFRGGLRSREWAWGKLLGVVYDAEHGWAAVQVSNRERTSGFTFGSLPADIMAGWVDVAVGLGRDAAGVATDLRAEIVALEGPPPAGASRGGS